MTPDLPARSLARALMLGERLDHREVLRANGTLTGNGDEAIACFGFRWGAVAMIGGTRAAQDALLARLAPHVVQPFDAPAEETAALVFDSAEDGVDPAGAILLRDRAPHRLALVAEELAKSAALSHQEARLAATFDRLEPLTVSLTRRGRLGARSRPLLRAIGEAMAARNRTTAHVDLSGKPDVLWDHPELERLHNRLVEEFELADRGAALDRKLALVGETVHTLLALIESRRSAVLEIAVATLIAIEVLTTLHEALFR